MSLVLEIAEIWLLVAALVGWLLARIALAFRREPEPRPGEPRAARSGDPAQAESRR